MEEGRKFLNQKVCISRTKKVSEMSVEKNQKKFDSLLTAEIRQTK